MPDTLTRPSARPSALDILREAMPIGTTVYTILRHTSDSGMLRHISVLTLPIHDGVASPRQWDHAVAEVTGRKLAKSEGIKCHGCGMDMGFDLVYSLSRALYGDGYALNHRWL